MNSPDLYALFAENIQREPPTAREAMLGVIEAIGDFLKFNAGAIFLGFVAGLLAVGVPATILAMVLA